MPSKTVARLIEQAKGDPKFFHALVFDPQSILNQLDYADREVKGAIIALDPEQLIRELIGNVSDCGVTVQCGDTCTHTSSSLGDLDEVINPAVNLRLIRRFRS